MHRILTSKGHCLVDSRVALAARRRLHGYIEATRAGIRMLESGGNAVDAAVTAAFAASSSAPGASGLGGTTYILIHMADGRSVAIDGSSRVPMRVERDELIALKEKEEKIFGVKTAAVPGTLAALDHALRVYGTRPLAETLAPAIEIAENGFEITSSKRASIAKYLDVIRKTDYLRTMLLDDDQELPEIGTRIGQPKLADTLRRIAAHGAADFYRGDIAREIVADMTRRGGYIQLADLAMYRVKERQPLRGTYRHAEIVAFPWPSSGGAIIEGLNILENSPSEFLCTPSANRLQAVIEAFHIALEDHYRFTATAAVFDQATDFGYTAKEFAAERAALIQFDHALTPEEFAPARRSYETQAGTTQVSVVDRFGNIVSLTQTLGRFYGGKALHPELGIIYNSFVEGFDLADPAAMKPRAACPTDMSPTIVLDDGCLLMALGSAASARIPGVVATVISNAVDCDLGPAAAVLAPRALWSTGQTIGTIVEKMPPVTRKHDRALENRGYEIAIVLELPAERREFIKFGAVNVVSYDPELAKYCAVADPRRQGFAMAAGY